MSTELHDIRHMIENGGMNSWTDLLNAVAVMRNYLDQLDDRVSTLEFNAECDDIETVSAHGREWVCTGREWNAIDDIPAGVLVVPEFDDLRHPMRKTVYEVVSKSYRHPGGNYRFFVDEADGEQFSAEAFGKWWGWTARFVEVRR